MNRGMKYRKTIAYGMIVMMLLQLFTGTNVTQVSATEMTEQQDITFGVEADTVFTSGDCDADGMWRLPYEIKGFTGEEIQLSIERTQEGESTPTALLSAEKVTAKEENTGVPLSEQSFENGEILVCFDAEGAVQKGAICVKQDKTKKASYTIKLQVTGADNTTSEKSISVSFVEQILAPTIEITNITEGLEGAVVADSATGTWTKQDVEFQVKISDADTALKSITYELDGKPETVDLSGQNQKTADKTYQITTTAPSHKGHVLHVTATNEKNETADYTGYILVDKEAPTIGSFADGTNHTLEADKVYTSPLTFTTTVGDIEAADQLTVQFEVNGVLEPAVEQGGQYIRLFDQDGTYQVRVIAVDEAGNRTESAMITFQVDGACPVIQITSGQQDKGCYAQGQQLAYTVADDNLSGGKVTLQASRTLDGNTESKQQIETKQLTNGLAEFSYMCQEDGYYEITIDAEDAAGNPAVQQQISFTVDTESPVGRVTAEDKDSVKVADKGMTKDKVTVNFQVEDRNLDLTQCSVITKRKDADGNWSQDTTNGSRLQWKQTASDSKQQKKVTATTAISYTEEGYYEVTLTGKDKAGNDLVATAGESQTISFYIDRTAPEINDIRYITENIPISPKYGIIFSNKEIRVEFSVKDKMTGLKESEPVYVTIGKKTDRDRNTILYPAMPTAGGSDIYYVVLPLEKVEYFDDRVTIWAYDQLLNEQAVESERTIYNTNSSVIGMQCTTGNAEQWTNKDVTYRTTIRDTYCGIRKITYSIIETVNEQEYKNSQVIDFDEKYKQGEISDLQTVYTFDFTATESAKTVEGYVLQVKVENNCGTVTSMEKRVYIDKEAPVVELSGITNGEHYKADQAITTKVKDISYKGTPAAPCKRTTTKYYITCQYDGQNKSIIWNDFVSQQYEDLETKVFSQEGYYEIYAVTTDGAGNKTTSNTLRFVIDKQPPVIDSVRVIKGGLATEQLANPDGIYYVNADARLDVQVTEHFPSPDSYIWVEGVLGANIIQQEQFAIVSSPYGFVTRVPYTAEGKYKATLTGRDKAGNVAVPVVKDIVVDKTSPQLSIAGIESGKMTRDAVSLTYRAEDKNHDFAQYKVTVHRRTLDGVDETVIEQNAADWTQTGYDRNAQNNYTTVKTSTYTEEGNYEITLEGVDQAGNIGVVQSVAFTIDRTAPVISDVSYFDDTTGLLAAKYGIIFSNRAIQVRFRATDRVAGVEDAYVYVTLGEAKDRLENAPLYLARKDAEGYYYVYVPSDLALTEYDGVITLWANDRLHNESNAQTIRMIQNTDKPEIVMDCDLDYTKWQSKDVTFHTKVADNKSGLSEVTYSIDGKEVKKVVFTDFVKEYTYDLTATKTADKVSGYTVAIEVTNNNGTKSEAVRRVYIDKKAPVVKLSGVENGTHYNKTQIVKTEVEDVSFKNTKTEYYVTRILDGTKYTEKLTAFTLRRYEDQCTRRFRKEGRYQVYAITTDSAGNRTKSNTLRFVVDKTAPKLEVSGVENGSMNGSKVTVQFDLTDSFYETTDTQIRIEKTLDGGTTHSEITTFPKKGKHSVWNKTFEEDGTYDITFTAKDRAGNVAKTKRLAFSVDCTKPEIQITGTSNYEQWDRPVTVRFAVEESYYAGNHITIKGTRQDINGKVEELELPAIANTAKLSSLVQTFSKDGIYDFVISTKDEAGNQDEKQIHFILDQTRPEIHKVEKYQGGYYQEFKIADTLEEVFKDLTVVSYRILLNGIEYDGTTPVTEEGKYNLSVEVQDELGHTSTENAEFIIDHTAPKVIFTGVKDGQSVTESGSVTLSLTNPEDEIIGVSMNGVEYDADTRQLDYAEYGAYHIDVECVDKAGNHVIRSIQFTYHNPLTTMILFAIMGGLMVMTCIWLWVRSIRKEKEEEKI